MIYINDLPNNLISKVISSCTHFLCSHGYLGLGKLSNYSKKKLKTVTTNLLNTFPRSGVNYPQPSLPQIFVFLEILSTLRLTRRTKLVLIGCVGDVFFNFKKLKMQFILFYDKKDENNKLILTNVYHKVLLEIAQHRENMLNAKASDAAHIPYKNCHVLSCS